MWHYWLKPSNQTHRSETNLRNHHPKGLPKEPPFLFWKERVGIHNCNPPGGWFLGPSLQAASLRGEARVVNHSSAARVMDDMENKLQAKYLAPWWGVVIILRWSFMRIPSIRFFLFLDVWLNNTRVGFFGGGKKIDTPKSCFLNPWKKESQILFFWSFRKKTKHAEKNPP